MKTNYQPGFTEITRLDLVRYPGTSYNRSTATAINIMPQVVTFNIYEDIFKPTIYADFFMKDVSNILQNFGPGMKGPGIRGDEHIEVEFKTPGATQTSFYSFAVISVENKQDMPNKEGQFYTLRCISHEHLMTTQRLVTKSYNDYAENIIADILFDYLNIKDSPGITKKFYFENSKDIVKITIPKLNPLKAIDMVRQRAISRKFPQSPFLFFENRDGFNFYTADWLIDYYRNNVGSQVYTMSTTTNLSDTSGNSFEKLQFRNIEAFQMLGNQNTHQKMQQGAQSNLVKSFDFTTKAFNIKKFDIKEANPITTDKKGNPNLTQNLLERFKTPGLERFVPTSIDIGTNIADVTGGKQSFKAFFGETSANILVQGDTGLTVGEVIELKLPDLGYSSGPKEDDKLTSGNYMITKIRHMLSADEHKMSMEITKLGTAT